MEEIIASIRNMYTSGTINAPAVEELLRRVEVYLNSGNEAVEKIATNLDGLKSREPRFKVMSSLDNTTYLKDSKEMRIKEGSGIEIDRALGLALADILGEPEEKEVKKFIQDARVSCVSEENIGKFGEYLGAICDDENEKRTSFETGPISNIICSVFQYPVLNVGGEKFTLPSKEKKLFFTDLSWGGLDTAKLFAENIANYFTLVANGRSTDLDILREFLGEGWISSMDEHLSRISSKMKSSKPEIGTDTKTK